MYHDILLYVSRTLSSSLRPRWSANRRPLIDFPTYKICRTLILLASLQTISGMSDIKPCPLCLISMYGYRSAENLA